jgi:magnesium transporter
LIVSAFRLKYKLVSAGPGDNWSPRSDEVSFGGRVHKKPAEYSHSMSPLEPLLRAFVELHPEDAARALETLNAKDAVRLFKNLPVRVAVELLRRISPDAAEPLLEQLDVHRIGQLVSQMSPRAATALVSKLNGERRDQVLAEVSESTARPIRALLGYSAQTAGGIMEPRVASLPIDLTAQQAIAKIRKTPRDVLHYLYVTQRDGGLIGVVNMRDLLLAAPRDRIEMIVNRNVLSIQDTMDREEAINLMRERGFLALPVVDYEGRLIGVVRHQDALRAGQMEAFEDLQRSVGAGADERALSPISTVVKSRLPWLGVNLLTAFLASGVVSLFEGIISQVAALAILLPIVAGQGGNTGSQSLAVVMRGLALREIIPGAKKRVVIKEAAAGLINGLIIASVTAACVFGWRWLEGDSLTVCVGLALVIGLAMIVNMVVATACGATIPLALKAMGRDPAQSAAIFLSTATDVIGFAAFLGFASAFSQMIV